MKNNKQIHYLGQTIGLDNIVRIKIYKQLAKKLRNYYDLNGLPFLSINLPNYRFIFSKNLNSFFYKKDGFYMLWDENDYIFDNINMIAPEFIVLNNQINDFNLIRDMFISLPNTINKITIDHLNELKLNNINDSIQYIKEKDIYISKLINNEDEYIPLINDYIDEYIIDVDEFNYLYVKNLIDFLQYNAKQIILKIKFNNDNTLDEFIKFYNDKNIYNKIKYIIINKNINLEYIMFLKQHKINYVYEDLNVLNTYKT